MAVEHEVAAVVLGAEFGAAHIFQAHQRAIPIGLQNDVLELGGLGEPANGPHADLKLLSHLDGRLPHLAGGNLDILLLEGVDHIGRGQGATGHALGIEPQPHGVFARAKNHDVGHSGHALQRVLNVNVQVVAHEQRSVAVAFGEQGGAEHKIVGRLGDGDAGGFDRRRQAALRRVHPVLHVDRSQVRIAVEVEGGDDRTGTVIAAARGDVLHPLGAVDFLFEGNGDGGFDGLRAGTGVEAGD